MKILDARLPPFPVRDNAGGAATQAVSETSKRDEDGDSSIHGLLWDGNQKMRAAPSPAEFGSGGESLSCNSLSPVLLLTGGARRVGRFLARRFAQQGWSVAIHFHTSSNEAQELVQLINQEAKTERAIAFRADLSEEKQVQALFAKAWEWQGGIHCLINNAALFQQDSWETATQETLNAHFAVNFQAPFLLTQLFAQALQTASDIGPGIANVINLVDYQINAPPSSSFPFFSYALSKSSLWDLTQKLALSLAPLLRVNGVGLGYVLPPDSMAPEKWRERISQTPLQRETSLEELLNTLLFILKTPSLTGQLLWLDSGQHLKKSTI